MRKTVLLAGLLGLVCCGVASAGWAELDEARIGRLQAQLGEVPAGLGPVCADRTAWGDALVAQRLAAVRKAAEKLLTADFPPWDDAAYLEFSRTGQRSAGERMMNLRKAWLYPLVMAECVEWQGRYLAAIARTLGELNAQPSWTWPAHDAKLANIRDRVYHVDLFAADMAHDMAQALYLLGDRLPPALRGETLKALEQRVFAPVLRSLRQGNGAHWWLAADHNWNAVCLKGVVGAALAVLPREQRAVFVAAGEHYSRKYVAGFPEDGYATEGPGYWNYGFSHFAVLRELLMQATGGQLDLFATERVRAIAQYGRGIEILPGNVPPFGDASRNTRMDAFTLAYANEALGLGQDASLASVVLSATPASNDSPLAHASLALFVRPQAVAGRAVLPAEKPLSTWFAQVGVLVSRPAPGNRLGVAIKSGGNGNHSHNDIGSYVVALGSEQPTGDPGRTAYTARTFSSARYTIRGINSWGHPVPVVDGVLQREATKVRPRVLATRFADETDELLLDLAPAYDNDDVRRLTRSLRHERAGQGRIEIEDRFVYDAPGRFEVPLILNGSWEDRRNGELVLWQRQERLLVRIEASSAWELVSENVDEEGIRFTRIAIRLRERQREGWVRVSYAPL